MVALIITIISAILCSFDVITSDIAIGLIIGAFVWALVGTGLYFKFGFLKFFYPDFLGWHTPDGSAQWSDGCSQHSICKHCGRDIMQDSQGNWFC